MYRNLCANAMLISLCKKMQLEKFLQKLYSYSDAEHNDIMYKSSENVRDQNEINLREFPSILFAH